MKLTLKEEDYLETIYLLLNQSASVGITDIAHARGVTLPTVFSAVSRLKDNGLVAQSHYGKVTLTVAGAKAAAEVFEIHRILKMFFAEVLQLSEELAEQNACRIEHGISREAVTRLEGFIDIVRNCSGKGTGCMLQKSLSDVRQVDHNNSLRHLNGDDCHES
jgi:DtxR family transcriptional regulator, Mn-dependent transcriptional regulator